MSIMTDIDENIPTRCIASQKVPEATDMTLVAFSITIIKKNPKQFTCKKTVDIFMRQRVGCICNLSPRLYNVCFHDTKNFDYLDILWNAKLSNYIYNTHLNNRNQKIDYSLDD